MKSRHILKEAIHQQTVNARRALQEVIGITPSLWITTYQFRDGHGGTYLVNAMSRSAANSIVKAFYADDEPPTISSEPLASYCRRVDISREELLGDIILPQLGAATSLEAGS